MSAVWTDPIFREQVANGEREYPQDLTTDLFSRIGAEIGGISKDDFIDAPADFLIPEEDDFRADLYRLVCEAAYYYGQDCAAYDALLVRLGEKLMATLDAVSEEIYDNAHR